MANGDQPVLAAPAASGATTLSIVPYVVGSSNPFSSVGWANSSLISWYVPSVVVDPLPSLIPAGSFISVPNGSNTDYLMTAADAAAGATVIELAPPDGGGWVATPQSGAGWASGATLSPTNQTLLTPGQTFDASEIAGNPGSIYTGDVSAISPSVTWAMYDCQTGGVANLPANAPMVAPWTPMLAGLGGISSTGWTSAQLTAYASARKWTYSQDCPPSLGGVGAALPATDVLDLEDPDGIAFQLTEPSDAVTWVLSRRALGYDPIVYVDITHFEDVWNAFNTAGVVQPHYWYAFYDLHSAQPSLFPNALPALATGHSVAGGTTGVTSLTLATAYGYALPAGAQIVMPNGQVVTLSSAASASATTLSIDSINVSSGMGWPTGYWLSPTFSTFNQPYDEALGFAANYNNLAWVGLGVIALQYAASEGTLLVEGLPANKDYQADIVWASDLTVIETVSPALIPAMVAGSSSLPRSMTPPRSSSWLSSKEKPTHVGNVLRQSTVRTGGLVERSLSAASAFLPD